MSKRGRIGVVLILLAAFAMAVIIKESSKHSVDLSANAGTQASNFPIETTDSLNPDAQSPGAVGEENLETAASSVFGDASGPAGGIPRLLDLGSTKCIPCKMMAPILEELKTDNRGRLAVEFIDVRENRAEAQRYEIRVIPTQIFFDASGTERFRHEGFMDKETILAKWKELGVDLAAP